MSKFKLISNVPIVLFAIMGMILTPIAQTAVASEPVATWHFIGYVDSAAECNAAAARAGYNYYQMDGIYVIGHGFACYGAAVGSTLPNGDVVLKVTVLGSSDLKTCQSEIESKVAGMHCQVKSSFLLCPGKISRRSEIALIPCVDDVAIY